MDDLDGKIVLITGAGTGKGRELAVAFAARHATVAANDITPINLDVTIEAIRASGGCAKDYIVDIAKKMPVQALLNQVLDDWGHIDMLINCASVRPKQMLLEMDEWDWQRTVDVNLSAVFYMIQSGGRVMRDQGGGVILNIATHPEDAGVEPGLSAFLASRTALIALTRQAAFELAPFNIRVNAICPGKAGNGWIEMAIELCRQSADAPTGQIICIDNSAVAP